MSKAHSLTAPLPDLVSLLAAHGLAGVPERPFAHTGFSGALITRLQRPDGETFILKRLSIERDWIMRVTNDISCREAAFAAAALPLPHGIATPSLGAATDGAAYAVLMRDISASLLPQGPIGVAQLDAVIAAMARLHAAPLPPSDAVPWCTPRPRLSLLTRQSARVAEAYGAPVAGDLIEGWTQFDRLAPADVVALIARLAGDPSPLLDALDEMPRAFLHGDLKLDNIGLDPDGTAWLIDWSMPMLAPPAIELGWFLAINSRRFPVSLDDTIARYADAARIPRALHGRHTALAVLCGLALRGWRKGLDAAEGEPDELRWWSEHARDAAALLRL